MLNVCPRPLACEHLFTVLENSLLQSSLLLTRSWFLYSWNICMYSAYKTSCILLFKYLHNWYFSNSFLN